MTGRIVRLTKRGYGFIADDDGGPDVFFVASDCDVVFEVDLRVGQPVTFAFGTCRRTGRPLARHVRPIDATRASSSRVESSPTSRSRVPGRNAARRFS